MAQEHLGMELKEEKMIECCFKINGCSRRLSKEELESHEVNCGYDLKKFGTLISICEVLGHKDCEFKFNDGMGNEAVDHFRTLHGYNYVRSDCVTHGLTGFHWKEANDPRLKFYDPTIMKLEREDFYLITFSVKKGPSLANLTLWIPSVFKKIRPDFQIQYKFAKVGEAGKIAGGYICPPVYFRHVGVFLAEDRFRFLCEHQMKVVWKEFGTFSWVKLHVNVWDQTGKLCGEGPAMVCNPQVALPFWNSGENNEKKKKIFKEFILALGSTRMKLDEESKHQFFLELLSQANELHSGDKTMLKWISRCAMYMTCAFGSSLTLQYLLENGAEVNMVNEFGFTPLIQTLVSLDPEVAVAKADLLISNEADPLVQCHSKMNFFHHAIARYKLLVAKKFLGMGFNVNLNYKTKRGSALQICFKEMHRHQDPQTTLEIAKWLIESGAKKVSLECLKQSEKLKNYLEENSWVEKEIKKLLED